MSQRLIQYLDELRAHGRYSFSKAEAAKALQLSPKALQSALYRLIVKKHIVAPVRGLYLILLPEYRKMGCPPPIYFIDALMKHWQQSYYIALLSAAQVHGVAHQQPQVFYVMTNKFRRPIHCGQIKIIFVSRKNISNVPIQKVKTSYGYVNVSTPEATAIDMLEFPKYCVSMSHIATILSELSEEMRVAKLIQLVETKKQIASIQRLGYLCDKLKLKALSSALHEAIKHKRCQPCSLQKEIPIRNSAKNRKWNVYINVNVEGDEL